MKCWGWFFIGFKCTCFNATNVRDWIHSNFVGLLWSMDIICGKRAKNLLSVLLYYCMPAHSRTSDFRFSYSFKRIPWSLTFFFGPTLPGHLSCYNLHSINCWISLSAGIKSERILHRRTKMKEIRFCPWHLNRKMTKQKPGAKAGLSVLLLF